MHVVVGIFNIDTAFNLVSFGSRKPRSGEENMRWGSRYFCT